MFEKKVPNPLVEQIDKELGGFIIRVEGMNTQGPWVSLKIGRFIKLTKTLNIQRVYRRGVNLYGTIEYAFFFEGVMHFLLLPEKIRQK